MTSASDVEVPSERAASPTTAPEVISFSLQNFDTTAAVG
jgi:hypothetical protein